MSDLVRAKCPHCQNVLRLPAAWLGQNMRCKFCQRVIQIKKPAISPPSLPVDNAAIRAKATEAAKPPAVKSISSSGRPAELRPRENGSPFDFDDMPDEPPPLRRPKSRKPQPSGTWWKGVSLVVCVLAVVAVLGILFGPSLLRPGSGKPQHDKKIVEGKERVDRGGNEKVVPPLGEDELPPEDDPKPAKTPVRKDGPKVEPPPFVKPKVEPPPPVKVSAEPFPRRALLVSVANYLYANPVQYGTPATDRSAGSSTGALRKHFVNILHMPANQIEELSDRGTPPHPPLKPVIESTIGDFLRLSRGQDRIILLFAGNAVEIDKEAYLVPQEADPDDPQKLISLKWLYDRLRECPARQKVLIVDVCRLDPVRGTERAGGEPMGNVLNERLLQAPAGVQVWSACSPKQQSYEVEGGSAFLAGLCASLKTGLTIQSQGAPLPLDTLLPRVNASLNGRKLQQVSRLTGKEADGGAPYNADEPLPAAVKINQGPAAKGNFANKALVAGIMKEINAVPGPHAVKGKPREALPAQGSLPFPAKALQGYEADYSSLEELQKILAQNKQKYPLRAAVLNAIKTLDDSVTKFIPRESFSGNVSDQVKKQIHAEQRVPGQLIANLESALAALEKAGKDRDKETSKRWQANYDFTVVRLKSRLVVLYEYNNLLAQIRGDALPPLTEGATGYRVSPRKKVQVAESAVKTWVKDVSTTWTKILRDYPDTPWAVMARREQPTFLGMEWRPFRP